MIEKLKELEGKTGYPKSWFLVAGGAVLTLFLVLLGGAKLIVDLLGFVYPAYMSFKSMDTGNHTDNTQWLTYWVVFSFGSIVEHIFSFVVAFIPMYYWFKIAAVIVSTYPYRYVCLCIFTDVSIYYRIQTLNQCFACLFHCPIKTSTPKLVCVCVYEIKSILERSGCGIPKLKVPKRYMNKVYDPF